LIVNCPTSLLGSEGEMRGKQTLMISGRLTLITLIPFVIRRVTSYLHIQSTKNLISSGSVFDFVQTRTHTCPQIERPFLPGSSLARPELLVRVARFGAFKRREPFRQDCHEHRQRFLGLSGSHIDYLQDLEPMIIKIKSEILCFTISRLIRLIVYSTKKNEERQEKIRVLRIGILHPCHI
ncbi:hypothetical protein L9F63_019914, partial [Diploptera punctata]